PVPRGASVPPLLMREWPGREAGPQAFLERLARAPEGQLVPGNAPGIEGADLQRLHPAADFAPHDVGFVDHDDDRPSGVRVDVDETRQADHRTDLLPRLAQRRLLQRLASIDVAAGEHPPAVGRL